MSSFNTTSKHFSGSQALPVCVLCGTTNPGNAASAYVYSGMGQLVRQVPLAAEAGAVATLPTLPAGLYHVVVRDGAGTRVATQRLLVAGQ